MLGTMNRTSDGALEGQRTILMTGEVEESARQHEQNGAQLHAHDAELNSHAADAELDVNRSGKFTHYV